MSKNDNDIVELLAAAGIIGIGAVGIVIVAFVIVSVLMLIPASIVYFLLPYFGLIYTASFFQCWAGCMILRLIGGLLFGGKTNSSN